MSGSSATNHPMRTQITRATQVAIDMAALTIALGLAFLIRFDWSPPTTMVGRFILVAPYVVCFQYLVLRLFGVHRFAWRYVGLRETRRIAMAITVAILVLVFARVVAGKAQAQRIYFRHGVIPYGILAADYLLAFLGIVGVRVARRLYNEHTDRGKRTVESVRVPTMLVGAGQAGLMVARELVARPDVGVEPVGFLDDDPAKVGTIIHGIPVVGTTAQLPELCREYGAEQVVIAMASAPGEAIRRIRQLAQEGDLPTKIIPGVYEIVGGRVNLSRIRDVAIEDLLRRAPIDLDLDSLYEYVEDRVALVTGAGGSIGSELCRQLCRFKPQRLVLVERAETSLFHIHRELRKKFPQLDIVPCIADVTDEERMTFLFETHRPALVLHAAAHKHVPMMEWNPGEAVKNNVFGSKLVADLAHEYGALGFVMISTDKAVNPSSVMGATKRVAEMYIQALAATSRTRFVTVRFGNVLGSAGSVIPIFKEQIKNGGPVTVTHPKMRRYFMTIPEACQLVLQAGAMGDGGEIFILDMGTPVHIVDLARDLIRLSGLKEGEDIDIEFTGMRPGEKLFEELATSAEEAEKTRHPKIFIGHDRGSDMESVTAHLVTLDERISSDAHADVSAMLRVIVPEYKTPDVDDDDAEPSEDSLAPVEPIAAALRPAVAVVSE